MTRTIDVDHLEQFRRAVASRIGIDVEPGRLDALERLLRHRLDATRLPAPAYLVRLSGPEGRDEVPALADALTIGETYFFRHTEQLRAFAEVVLPARARAGGGRPLRVLSAGCASGEEAYSLAIVARETPRDPGCEVGIVGVDVNPVAIARARRARYLPWATRGMPEDARRRWLRAQGREYVLDESLRRDVHFEERNLVDGALPGEPEPYDAIFCRNVLMYFLPDRARALVERLAGVLHDDGFLFLGHAETLRGLSTDFELCHTHDAFYYRRRPRRDGRAGIPAHAADRSIPARAQAPPPAASAVRAAPPERPARRRTDHHDPVPPAPRRWDLSGALGLLRQERFAEGLAIMEGLPSEAAGDPDVLLLHAALLTQAGELARAAAVCERLIAADGLHAGAHYLLALCHEGDGRGDRAAHHAQVAAYLDPGFAMPRLHLGLLARRGGDRWTARRELERALELLQREDASRVLLFGGGFGRETLLELCRAELRHCEDGR